MIAEYQAQGSNAAQLAAQYGWQPEGVWGTDPVWIKTTPTGGSQVGYFYYQNDHLGTPQKIIDGQGQSVWSQKATAFGETTVDAASALVNNLRFPGQYFDAETDLHYNGFRDYDPGIGRYSESDPIGLMGGINSYAYVGNNSLNWIDIFGLLRDEYSRSNDRSFERRGHDIPPPPPSCQPPDDDKNGCDQQLEEEEESCYNNYGLFGPRGSNYALNGCLIRAFDRYVACLQGRSGPPPWSDADVDSWQPPKAPK